MRTASWRIAATAVLAFLVSPQPASAAAIVYRLTGSFDATVSNNGFSSYVPVGAGTFTGIGDTDDVVAGIGFTAIRLSSFTFSLRDTVYTARQPFEFFVYPTASLAGFRPQSGGAALSFGADAFAGYDPGTPLGPVTPQNGSAIFPLDTDRGALNVGVVVRNAFSATPGAAVPEPATWGMMIAGFALVGAAMRRRTLPERQHRLRVAVRG